jgi:hypothetical protein
MTPSPPWSPCDRERVREGRGVSDKKGAAATHTYPQVPLSGELSCGGRHRENPEVENGKCDFDQELISGNYAKSSRDEADPPSFCEVTSTK